MMNPNTSNSTSNHHHTAATNSASSSNNLQEVTAPLDEDEDDHQFAFAALTAAQALSEHDEVDDPHAAIGVDEDEAHHQQQPQDHTLIHPSPDNDENEHDDVVVDLGETALPSLPHDPDDPVTMADSCDDDMDVVEALQKQVEDDENDVHPNPLSFVEEHGPPSPHPGDDNHHQHVRIGEPMEEDETERLLNSHSSRDDDHLVVAASHSLDEYDDPQLAEAAAAAAATSPETVTDTTPTSHGNNHHHDIDATMPVIHPGDPRLVVVEALSNAQPQQEQPFPSSSVPTAGATPTINTTASATTPSPPSSQPQPSLLQPPQSPPAALLPPTPPELTNPICCICGQGNEEGRSILRFLPVPHEAPAARAAPGVVTFTEDVCLHIFCGKTASILPSVNRPDLEILTKAGLKNKHGIGPEVNSALARTRCAILLPAQGVSLSSLSNINNNKEKQYYLVREFEAHLASIRHKHIRFAPPQEPMSKETLEQVAAAASSTSSAAATGSSPSLAAPPPTLPTDPFAGQELVGLGDAYHVDVTMDYAALTATPGELAAAAATATSITKTAPVKASQTHKHTKRKSSISETQRKQQQQQQVSILGDSMPQGATLLPDGKVKCPCGGTHWPPSQQRGAQSWRNHLSTKRHQKWMEEQGIVGAV